MGDSDSTTDAPTAVPSSYAPSDDGEADEPAFRDEWDAAEWHSGDDVPWTMLPIEGLVDAVGAVIQPALRADPEYEETDRPSYAWLSANGFRGLSYTLSEYHDTTVATFWDEHIVEQTDDGYEWPIDDERTITLCEEFLEGRAPGQGWSGRTPRTKLYRLARFTRAYYEATSREDLVGVVESESDVSAFEATQQGTATIRRLDEELARTTVGRIFEVADAWYSWLIASNLAVVNPLSAAKSQFKFDSDVEDGGSWDVTPTLDAADVRSLQRTATSTREELLVVALCAWGLRTNEVAALHVSQLVLEGDDPIIAFDQRKNGPSDVSLLFGRDIVDERIGELARRDSWNGYLFPSDRSETGHVAQGTINRWFDDLANRAELGDVDGEKPVPKMGRRFWYDAYSDVVEEISIEVQKIAADQGSSDPQVVLDNYLSEERRRTMRREGMRQRLEDAFEVER